MRSISSRVVAGLAALAAFAVGVPAASASTVGLVTFTGHANVFADPVIWVGGGGDFGFDSHIGVYVGLYANTPVVSVFGEGDLHASGTYGSLVCGTSAPGGAASGGATLHAGPVSGTATFSIPFVVGQGIITGTFTEADADAGPLAGFATIFPNPPAPLNTLTGGTPNSTPGLPPSGTCVDNYGVAGSFAIVS